MDSYINNIQCTLINIHYLSQSIESKLSKYFFNIRPPRNETTSLRSITRWLIVLCPRKCSHLDTDPISKITNSFNCCHLSKHFRHGHSDHDDSESQIVVLLRDINGLLWSVPLTQLQLCVRSRLTPFRFSVGHIWLLLRLVNVKMSSMSFWWKQTIYSTVQFERNLTSNVSSRVFLEIPVDSPNHVTMINKASHRQKLLIGWPTSGKPTVLLSWGEPVCQDSEEWWRFTHNLNRVQIEIPEAKNRMGIAQSRQSP